MKVFYDHKIFEQQRIGGVSRYFAEIISRLSQEISTEIAVTYSNNVYLANKQINKILPILNYREEFLKGFEFKGKGRLFKILKSVNPKKYPDPYQINQQNTIELLKKQNFDLFHPTTYDPYFLDYIGNKPFVITIHDMIHEIFPEYFTANNFTSIYKKEIALRARHIIAVSENTKKDIINYYDIDENKISVIHHGSNAVKEIKEVQLKIPEKYILFVGTREGYKNFIFLIHSISDLLINSELFVICSGELFRKDELDLFRYLKIEKNLLHYSANENELNYLYQNALGFIFPSLYEGFGMPILEAFSNNCPVVLSKTSCFEEVTGNAGIYFDPKNQKEIQNVIRSLVNKDLYRTQLINKGKERLKLFSWKKTADRTRTVYEKALHV